MNTSKEERLKAALAERTAVERRKNLAERAWAMSEIARAEAYRMWAEAAAAWKAADRKVREIEAEP